MKYFVLSLALASTLSAAEFRTGQAARAIIGQQTFTRQGSVPSASVLGAASGVAYANDTLVVADSSRVPAYPQGNRVLVYRNLSGKVPSAKATIPLTDTRCPVCRAEADVVLGQPDFGKIDLGLAQNRFRTPTSVATDGQKIVVADTDNNRVLIWNSIPASNETPADVVIGQKDFTTGVINYGGNGNSPSAQGLRGPQGVWIQNGRLYVADTQNHRVLMWNSIPAQNGQNADLVLGRPDFTSFVEPDISKVAVSASATSMLNPVSVTSDGTRLYVTDLGHNRVLIWNSIPTQNGQGADIAIGQPDVASTDTVSASDPNNSRYLCPSNGTDSTTNNPTYPYACAATLSFPRYALSDGKRLFIADGGNDRILVFNSVPTRSGQPADEVLGQLNDNLVQDSDELRISAADSMRTPSSLAWDGSNLYVADPFNRRILVFTIGEEALPITGVRNAASRDIFAVGSVTFSADPKENDEVTIKIADAREYKFKAAKDQKIADVVTGLVIAINAGSGDPDVLATPNIAFNQLILTAKASGDAGNVVGFTATVSTGAQIQPTASGATLSGGQDAAKIAPGTLVSILGDHLADTTAVASNEGNDLPRNLAGVEVYMDGIGAPLLYVSPTQINTQMPFEVNDASSVTTWVRIEGKDGVRITNAIAVPVVPQNPGIFAEEGTDPRPGVAYHGSSYASGLISIDGTPTENDVVSITIGDDRTYSYTVKKDDTLAIIRDALIQLINDGANEEVTATAAGIYTRIVLRAKIPGPEGQGLKYSATGTDNVLLTAITTQLCCASQEGARITESDPAVPGETITIYATGLGLVGPDEAKFATVTGSKYGGPELNQPNSPVDDAIVGGKTANVLFAGMKPGAIGVYEVKLLLNPDIPTNPQTQLWIAQGFFVSNIVTFPVLNPSEATQ
jgi:hypothetical protein